MSDQYFFVMDSETGGLDPKQHDILTLYIAVTDMDFKIVDNLDLKLKPDSGLPVADQEALSVNKIDLQKHLEDPNTITYSQAKEKITELAKKYLKKRGRHSNLLILGQNVAFDIAFIKQHIFDQKSWESLFSYNVEDTKAACLFLKRCGWLPSNIGTLGSMVEYFNISRQTAHEARGDVLSTIEVYKALIVLMKSKKDGGQNTDLISLLEKD